MDNIIMNTIGNDSEADRLLNKHCIVSHLDKPFIEVGEDKYCMSITYKECAQNIHKFQVRDDDTYIAGFPRCGSTWTAEMVWLLVNDLDFEGAKATQNSRVPLIEIDAFPNALNTSKQQATFSYLNGLSSPRCIKTHLPWTLLPEEMTDGSKTPKIIYVLRNPKDACVSYYNFYRLFNGYQGSFQDFCTLFLEGRVINGPFWKSVSSFWKRRHLPNILFIRYKDMKTDLSSVINTVASFLGKRLDEMQMHQLVDHLNIENMRDNPAVNRDDAIEKYCKPFKLMIAERNNFIGRGEQNGYLSIMSPELIAKFEEWTKRNLEGSDLRVE